MFTSDVISTSSVSNVIYHKFSHGAAFYTLNGKNVNVMLEYMLNCHKAKTMFRRFKELNRLFDKVLWEKSC